MPCICRCMFEENKWHNAFYAPHPISLFFSLHTGLNKRMPLVEQKMIYSFMWVHVRIFTWQVFLSHPPPTPHTHNNPPKKKAPNNNSQFKKYTYEVGQKATYNLVIQMGPEERHPQMEHPWAPSHNPYRAWHHQRKGP